MKVGDILKSSWGWEQTNIDFYEVVKTTKTQITVRRIAAKAWEEDGYSSMSGFKVPVPGEFLEGIQAKEFRRKVLYNGKSIRINSYSFADLIEPEADGGFKKSYFSYYA